MNLASLKKQLRKCRATLSSAGYGIAVLTIWDFIKTVIYFSWYAPAFKETLSQPTIISLVVVFLVEHICCLTLAFVIIKSGKKNKKISVVTLIISILLLILAISYLGIDIFLIISNNGNNATIWISIISDIILAVLTVQILLSIVKLTKLSKNLLECDDER